MWFCFNDGFISVVADRDEESKLLVRARREQDIRNALSGYPEKVEIFTDAGADYRWRAFVDRDTFAKLVEKKIISTITYDNFKNSVKDRELHDLYSDFWNLHWAYQACDRAVKVVRKGGKSIAEVFKRL
jgi:hypothetical protein